MKIYSSVVVMTATTSTRKTLVRLKLNSSVACEIHSKPMNAHGEMQAILTICNSILLSGTNAGDIEVSRLKIATKKQTVIPTLNSIAMQIIALETAFLNSDSRVAKMTIATMVSRASPRYTS